MSLLRTIVKFVVILSAIALVVAHLVGGNVSFNQHRKHTASDGTVTNDANNAVSINITSAVAAKNADKSSTNNDLHRKDYPSRTPFTQVVADGDVDVYVYDAPRDWIVVKTPAGHPDLPCPEVVHGTLVIHGFDKRIPDRTPMVSIFRRGISGIEHNGSGCAYAEHLTGPHLRAVTTHGASLSIGGEGQEAHLRSAGDGDINVAWLAVSDLTVDMMGEGKVTPTGTWTRLTLTNAGSGEFAGDSTNPAVVTATVTGDSENDVGQAGSLHATVHGSGNVTYFGSPVPLITDVAGGGRVAMEMKP